MNIETELTPNPETLKFIVGILNELNTINLRNEILLTVLPLKV